MLRCEIMELPEVVLIELHGEIDITAMRKFRTSLEDAAQRQKPILLDMKHLQYLDTSAARVIEAFLPHAWDHAGPVAIISPAPQLRRGLELMEVTKQVPLFGSVSAALAWLRTSAPGLNDDWN